MTLSNGKPDNELGITKQKEATVLHEQKKAAQAPTTPRAQAARPDIYPGRLEHMVEKK